MRAHEALGLDGRRQPLAPHQGKVRPEPLDDVQLVNGARRHCRQPVVQCVPPQRALCEPEQRAAAARADLLIVVGAFLRLHLVAEAELPLDLGEVAHHHARRERLAAAAALRLFGAAAGVFVKADAELRGPLEDMKQFSERQPQQREDHRNGMEDREKVVGVSLHPRIARRQQQPRHADGEQQHQRQNVGYLLHGDGAVVDHPAAERNHDPGNNEHRRPHEAVKNHERGPRFNRKRCGREAEDERAVQVEPTGHGAELDPSPDQRERDGGREDAAPHDEPVRGASQRTSAEDETVGAEFEEQAA